MGAVGPADDGGLPHHIRREPERGTAECVETIQMLLADVHVGGGEVVAELFFGTNGNSVPRGELALTGSGHYEGHREWRELRVSAAKRCLETERRADSEQTGNADLSAVRFGDRL